MNRKQRIIISITGIVLVSLILIGLTYGYYLTKIKGNTNSKSISVVTANLLLEYADVNDELITDSVVEPGKSWTKTFVATNKGNKTLTYGVALENVVNQFERKDDIVYTLDCKQYSKTGFSIDKTNKTVTGTISGTCNGVSEETTFPSIGTILVQNDIADDKAQVYTLVVTYKNVNENQNVDMNKTFSAKANIVDPNNFNPYVNAPLKDVIVASAKSGANGTTYTSNLSAVGMVDNITTASDKILSTAEDDYGESYYFRGNPTDNYVNYAGMCWRIVRIEGDGSIKLILASEKTCSTENLTTSSGYATDGAAGTQGTILTAHYGYKMVGSYYINDYINSTGDSTGNVRTKLNAWLERKITSESDKALLKNETWCIGDQTNGYRYQTGKIVGKINDLINSGNSFEFTAGNKFYGTKTPSYKCEITGIEGEIDTNKVGILTFDEIVYAGGGSSSNSNYYLNNNAKTFWMILSPSLFASIPSVVILGVSSEGEIEAAGSVNNSSTGFRPSISLVSSTKITRGDGTKNNPYTVG